ncbi:hypothetical protein AgCh_029916 [Apium graveolens]
MYAKFRSVLHESGNGDYVSSLEEFDTTCEDKPNYPNESKSEDKPNYPNESKSNPYPAFHLMKERPTLGRVLTLRGAPIASFFQMTHITHFTQYWAHPTPRARPPLVRCSLKPNSSSFCLNSIPIDPYLTRDDPIPNFAYNTDDISMEAEYISVDDKRFYECWPQVEVAEWKRKTFEASNPKFVVTLRSTMQQT